MATRSTVAIYKSRVKSNTNLCELGSLKLGFEICPNLNFYLGVRFLLYFLTGHWAAQQGQPGQPGQPEQLGQPGQPGQSSQTDEAQQSNNILDYPIWSSSSFGLRGSWSWLPTKNGLGLWQWTSEPEILNVVDVKSWENDKISLSLNQMPEEGNYNLIAEVVDYQPISVPLEIKVQTTTTTTTTTTQDRIFVILHFSDN